MFSIKPRENHRPSSVNSSSNWVHSKFISYYSIDSIQFSPISKTSSLDFKGWERGWFGRSASKYHHYHHLQASIAYRHNKHPQTIQLICVQMKRQLTQADTRAHPYTVSSTHIYLRYLRMLLCLDDAKPNVFWIWKWIKHRDVAFTRSEKPINEKKTRWHVTRCQRWHWDGGNTQSKCFAVTIQYMYVYAAHFDCCKNVIYYDVEILKLFA